MYHEWIKSWALYWVSYQIMSWLNHCTPTSDCFPTENDDLIIVLRAFESGEKHFSNKQCKCKTFSMKQLLVIIRIGGEFPPSATLKSFLQVNNINTHKKRGFFTLWMRQGYQHYLGSPPKTYNHRLLLEWKTVRTATHSISHSTLSDEQERQQSSLLSRLHSST